MQTEKNKNIVNMDEQMKKTWIKSNFLNNFSDEEDRQFNLSIKNMENHQLKMNSNELNLKNLAKLKDEIEKIECIIYHFIMFLTQFHPYSPNSIKKSFLNPNEDEYNELKKYSLYTSLFNLFEALGYSNEEIDSNVDIENMLKEGFEFIYGKYHDLSFDSEHSTFIVETNNYNDALNFYDYLKEHYITPALELWYKYFNIKEIYFKEKK